MCGIYCITNLKTGKVYIGQSIDINRRWSEHKSRAFDSNNNCYNKPLYRSMRKHGLDTFKLDVLLKCDQAELNKYEREYIILYNSVTPYGYNVLNANNAPYYTKAHRCSKCNKLMHYDTVHNLCRDCYVKYTRKLEWPTKEELQKLLIEYKGNFSAVSKLFNVSDNAVRKWCKSYGLPHLTKAYKIMQH